MISDRRRRGVARRSGGNVGLSGYCHNWVGRGLRGRAMPGGISHLCGTLECVTEVFGSFTDFVNLSFHYHLGRFHHHLESFRCHSGSIHYRLENAGGWIGRLMIAPARRQRSGPQLVIVPWVHSQFLSIGSDVPCVPLPRVLSDRSP
jgi:hypothetical protein